MQRLLFSLRQRHLPLLRCTRTCWRRRWLAPHTLAHTCAGPVLRVATGAPRIDCQFLLLRNECALQSVCAADIAWALRPSFPVARPSTVLLTVPFTVLLAITLSHRHQLVSTTLQNHTAHNQTRYVSSLLFSNPRRCRSAVICMCFTHYFAHYFAHYFTPCHLAERHTATVSKSLRSSATLLDAEWTPSSCAMPSLP
jgi:hypothetical protein